MFLRDYLDQEITGSVAREVNAVLRYYKSKIMQYIFSPLQHLDIDVKYG